VTGASLEVDGLAEVEAILTGLSDSDSVVTPALTNWGKLVQTEAIRLAPRKTGALAAAISTTFYPGGGGVSIKVDTTTAPHGYTFHATALGMSSGGFTFRVPGTATRQAYTRKAYIPNKPFLFLAAKAKEQELVTLVEDELSKVVT
jgi:hypothetical protein